MFFKSSVIKVVFGALSLVSLALPFMIQLGHIFSTHEHKQCVDSKVHFHQKKVNCNLFDYHLTSGVTFSPETVTFYTPQVFKKLNAGVVLRPYNASYFISFLRGPPKFI